jgi:hypothetical protein
MKMKMKVKISKDKTYKTLNGHEVRIYETEGTGFFPVYGSIKQKDGWKLLMWNERGSSPTNCAFNLVEVKPKIQRSYWVNVYEQVILGHCASKEEADKAACSNRLACVEVKIDCCEGDGL